MANEPHKRDWLTEAFKIAEGGSSKGMKREHLLALKNAYTEVSKRHTHLQKLMTQVFDEVKRKRAAAGLPEMPPPPESLQAELKTPVRLS